MGLPPFKGIGDGWSRNSEKNDHEIQRSIVFSGGRPNFVFSSGRPRTTKDPRATSTVSSVGRERETDRQGQIGRREERETQMRRRRGRGERAWTVQERDAGDNQP
ncbi:unnamed protein product [Prunus armeniaca]